LADARRPEVAIRAFARAQSTITSCVVTQQISTRNPVILTRDPQLLVFSRGPVSLRNASGGPSGLLLDVRQQIVVVPADARKWRIELRMYEYRILDQAERELLVYHWQPGPSFRGPNHPHMHVSSALHAQVNAVTTRAYDLDKRHLATGHVSLAMMVRMLIEEFGIAPLRPDWRQVLERAEQTTMA
jgi:hypothetical protein